MIDNLEKLEKSEIMHQLDCAGVPQYFIGYKYIVTAVPIVIDSIYCNQKITLESIFKEVAKKHKTTGKKVECAIRYVHENTRIAEFLNCSSVSNKKLLYILAQIVIKKLRIEE